MMNREFSKRDFIDPPSEFGEVAFYRWIGDKLTKERLLWQLDRLKAHHVSGLQINYCFIGVIDVPYIQRMPVVLETRRGVAIEYVPQTITA